MSASSRIVLALGAALLASACAAADEIEGAGARTVPERKVSDSIGADPGAVPLHAPAVSVPADAPGPVSAAMVGVIPPPPPVERPADVTDRGRQRTGTAANSGNRSTGTTPRTRSSAGSSAHGSGSASGRAVSTSPGGRFASSLFSAVNSERTSRGLMALAPSSCAERHAQRWAEQLASTGTFAHQSLEPVLDGCGAMSAGENIARGSSSVAGTISAWMGSAGHRANILDPEFTHGGMATVEMVDGRRVSVQVFLTL